MRAAFNEDGNTSLHRVAMNLHHWLNAARGITLVSAGEIPRERCPGDRRDVTGELRVFPLVFQRLTGGGGIGFLDLPFL